MEALRVQQRGQFEFTAGAAYACGEVLQLADGRAAVVVGLRGIANNDLGAADVDGIFDLASASATTFSQGERVFWDASANLAIGVGSIGAGDYFVGRAVMAKVSGQLVVRVDLNEPGGVPLRTVEAHTADDTLTVAESGTVHTTVGATGTVVLALPAATVGLEYFFRVGAAQELRIDPDGTEKISLPSTGVPGAAGKYLTANADGETVHLVCTKAGEWTAFGYTGTWTAEG